MFLFLCLSVGGALHSIGVVMGSSCGEGGKGGTGLTYPVLGEERRSDTWYTPLVLPDRLEFLCKIQRWRRATSVRWEADGLLIQQERCRQRAPRQFTRRRVVLILSTSRNCILPLSRVWLVLVKVQWNSCV